MSRIWMVLGVAALMAVPAAASQTTEVMAPVTQFVKDFNRGDVKAATADCADVTHIIDEFGPYQWQGAGACSRWLNALDADSRKEGATDSKVTLGAPRHVDVTGDAAYVVVPANYFFKLKGKTVSETGSVFTVVLKRGKSGWRIVAWTWSRH